MLGGREGPPALGAGAPGAAASAVSGAAGGEHAPRHGQGVCGGSRHVPRRCAGARLQVLSGLLGQDGVGITATGWPGSEPAQRQEHTRSWKQNVRVRYKPDDLIFS